VAAAGTADAAAPRRPPRDITTVVDLIEAGQIDLVINIPRGGGARADGYEIRRAALRRGVPTMTNAAAAHAAVQAIAAACKDREVTVTCLQDLHTLLAASAGGARLPDGGAGT
jgi:carbamoyl-phosphate synthase large subunit